jgi:hypothetical protein
MNAATLKALIDQLRADEARFKIQKHLTRLHEALNTFASQPQQPEIQIQVANALSTLEAALEEPLKVYDAAWRKRIDAIGATEFFSRGLTDRIRESIAANPMTPAVVRDIVGKLLKRRADYLQNLETASNSLKALGIEADARKVKDEPHVRRARGRKKVHHQATKNTKEDGTGSPGLLPPSSSAAANRSAHATRNFESEEQPHVKEVNGRPSSSAAGSRKR